MVHDLAHISTHATCCLLQVGSRVTWRIPNQRQGAISAWFFGSRQQALDDLLILIGDQGDL